MTSRARSSITLTWALASSTVVQVGIGVGVGGGGLGSAWATPATNGLIAMPRAIAEIVTTLRIFRCRTVLTVWEEARGIKSIFQSHEIDLAENRTTVGHIAVGVNAMTGTACTILKGAYLAEPRGTRRRIGSHQGKGRCGHAEQSLYAGLPARFVRAIDERLEPSCPLIPVINAFFTTGVPFSDRPDPRV
jgi:hypothetical protein